MKNKKSIIVLCSVAIIIIGVVIFITTSNNAPSETVQSNTPQKTQTAQPEIKEETANPEADKKEEKPENTKDSAKPQEPEKVYTPTFMYFVSNSDEDFENNLKMIEELKKEYKDKINFDIRNIDENPEDAENFALVQGKTPALIMLNTSNDICDLKLACSDKDILKQAIENSMS